MARLIDEGMIAQLSKKQGYFLKYFPARIRNVGEDAKEDRKLIYAFKDARDDAYKLVAQMVDGYLKREYGEQVKDMVFLCVPASRQEVNKSRYKEFCKEVSRLSGIKNGYSHLILMEDRLAVHERRRGREKEISRVSIMDFDKPFFKGKQVLIFDDIITTGGSYAIFAEEVEKHGAHVVGGLFLARTHYIYIRRYESDFQKAERCLHRTSLCSKGQGAGSETAGERKDKVAFLVRFQKVCFGHGVRF